MYCRKSNEILLNSKRFETFKKDVKQELKVTDYDINTLKEEIKKSEIEKRKRLNPNQLKKISFTEGLKIERQRLQNAKNNAETILKYIENKNIKGLKDLKNKLDLTKNGRGLYEFLKDCDKIEFIKNDKYFGFNGYFNKISYHNPQHTITFLYILKDNYTITAADYLKICLKLKSCYIHFYEHNKHKTISNNDDWVENTNFKYNLDLDLWK